MKKIISTILLLSWAAHAQHPLSSQAENYQQNEQFTHAIPLYEQITTEDPTDLNAFFNLGHCYLALGYIDNAIKAFEIITNINPTILPALYNCAYTKKTGGRLDEAIAQYQHIISIQNDYEPAHLALGFAYLTKGDFENGWKQHSRYLKRSGKNGDQLRMLLDTNTIKGKIILLRPEGGLGDTLQFIRYAQVLHTMGAYVIGCVQKPLIPLLSACPYIDELISPQDRVPYYDADATLMSLPAIFEDNADTFPNSIPYIYANTEHINHWKSVISNDTNFKIGLCWQADVQNDVSRLPIARRGCPLKNLFQLSDIPGVSFYSLQKYEGVEELAEAHNNLTIQHFENLDDNGRPFMDTAALIKNLDLIITVDTAVAHLAGGLGCRVWLLLPYATDWRWIKDRTDSPWYPTMKIFKQSKPFDWNEVITNVSTELAALI